jgi:gliding motility-associated-like protein
LFLVFQVLKVVGQSKHPSQDQSYLNYVQNKGQWNDKVLYKTNFRGGNLFLETSAFTYLFYPKDGFHNHLSHEKKVETKSRVFQFHSLRMDFEGAIPNHPIVASEAQSFYHNYFLGKDPKKWASRVGVYQTVTHKNIYNGIDVKVFGRDNNVRYDFIISPGANIQDIQLKFSGQDNLFLRDGKIILSTSVGEIIQEEPHAYQQGKDGQIKEIACSYVLIEKNIGIKVSGNFDKSLPLVIDPTLVFSTFTGSTSDNWGMSASFDQSGNGYTAGLCYGGGYPTTTGAFQTTFSGPGTYPGGDISLSKFNSTGTTLLFSTYLGGDSTDTPQSITVDNNNCLIVLGRTYSPNFPVVPGCYDVTKNGLGTDIVVTKINTTGTALIGSTYIGGSGDDGVNISDIESFLGSLKRNYADDGRGAVHVDANNNIYVASCTSSTDFPVSTGCFQPNNAGLQDGCVFKFNASLNNLLYSSYLGGSANDAAYNLALDAVNGIYVTGGTLSSNFPITTGALNTTYGGNIDGFVTHISASANAILQSSYVGTNLYEQSYFVQIDFDNDVYLYGQCSGNYQITAGTYSNNNSGQFIHKLDSTLSTTIFSTQFGTGNGTPDIVPSAFLVDNCKSIYISGWGGPLFGYNNPSSTTTGMPITANAWQSSTDGSDFYFASFKQNASALQFATFFGGSAIQEHVDGGTSCFDKTGVIYQAICAGCGGSSGMFTSATAWSTTNNSTNCNNALVKFQMDLINTLAQANLALNQLSGCAPFTASLQNTSTNAATFVWNFGTGVTSTALSPIYTYTNSGTYLITLIASDSTTCNKSDTALLIINVRPPAQLVPQLTPTFVCKGFSANLNINFPQANTYSWSPPASLSNPLVPNPIASPITSTIYTLTLNDSLCQVVSSRTVPVNVYQNITDIIDPGVCSGDTILLKTTGNYTDYNWNTGQISPTITVLLQGLYFVNTTDSNGCKGYDSVRIYPRVDITPQSFVICEGDHVRFNSPQGNYSYSWSPTTYMNSSNIFNPAVSPISTTIYTLLLRNGPCPSSNTFSVYVKPRPQAWIKTNGANLCLTDTVQISTIVKPSYFYLWDNGDTNPSIIVTRQGGYTVTVTDTNGCKAIDTLNLIGTPPWNLKPDRVVICEGQYAQLLADTGKYTYRWFPEIDIKGSNLPNPIVNPKSTSVYTAIVSNKRCTAIVQHTVIVKASPPLSLLSHHEIILPGETVQLGAYADSSCSWYPDYMISCLQCPNPEVSPLETTIYYCYVVNALGCSNTNTVVVEVIPTLYIPNSFTPNGDGENDVFRPVFSGFNKMKMSVYNRWGEEIYSYDSLEGGWNGKFKGEACPNGYYAYLLTATDNRGKVIEKAGSVLLLK